MPQKNIKELVKNEEWQKVRKSLLGQWKEKPTWCCDQLKRYLGSISIASNDKLRVVMNYTTGSVFRAKVVTHPCVGQIRVQISVEIKKRKAKGKWD
jgi:hypothetical protein